MKSIIIEKLNSDCFFLGTKDISSNIEAIAYKPQRKMLAILFQSNTNYIYEYSNVDTNTFLELLSSESLGKYFCANIKNKFNFKKFNCLTKKYE